MQFNVRLTMMLVPALIIDVALSSVHSPSLPPTSEHGEVASCASGRTKSPKLLIEELPSEFFRPVRISGGSAPMSHHAGADLDSPASGNPAFFISDLLSFPSRPLSEGGLAQGTQIVDITVGVADGELGFFPRIANISIDDTVRWSFDGGGHNVISGSSCNPDNKFCSPTDTNCSTAPTSGAGFVYMRTFNE